MGKMDMGGLGVLQTKKDIPPKKNAFYLILF
jgi:hypothetical protein